MTDQTNENDYTPSEAGKRLMAYAMLGQSLPPGPPGPPTHDHPNGPRCMWVRRGGSDRWRQVDPTGADLGPCPGFDQCCPGAGTMAHVRGCVNHPEADRAAKVEEMFPGE